MGWYQDRYIGKAQRIIKKLWKIKKQYADCIDAEHGLNERLLRQSKEGIDYNKLQKENKQLDNAIKKAKEWIEHLTKYKPAIRAVAFEDIDIVLKGEE